MYVVPYIIYKIVQWEKSERKSLKEENFMSKNITLLILNTLILPLIVTGIITSLETNYLSTQMKPNSPKFPDSLITNTTMTVRNPTPTNTSTNEGISLYTTKLDNDMNEFLARLISNSEEFFLRYLL